LQQAQRETQTIDHDETSRESRESVPQKFKFRRNSSVRQSDRQTGLEGQSEKILPDFRAHS